MDKLVASLELDKHIAETIMGFVDGECDAWRREKWGNEDEWRLVMGPDGCNHDHCYPPESPPRYSIDMGRAGQLLGKLFEWAAERDAVTVLAYATAFTGYRCSVYVPVAEDCLENDHEDYDEDYQWPVADDYYDTPQLAICEAAMRVLGGGG